MQPFTSQVQSACDYVKAATARLSGQAPPRHSDTEKTVREIRARIRKRVDVVATVPEAQCANAGDRKMLSWMSGKMIDVDVGKMDFLGSMNRIKEFRECLRWRLPALRRRENTVRIARKYNHAS